MCRVLLTHEIMCRYIYKILLRIALLCEINGCFFSTLSGVLHVADGAFVLSSFFSYFCNLYNSCVDLCHIIELVINDRPNSIVRL